MFRNLTLEFGEICKKYGSRASVVYFQSEKYIKKLTYNEVSELANSICDFLSRNGVRQDCVGLPIDYSLLLPCLILGIQKTESAFNFFEDIDKAPFNWLLLWTSSIRLVPPTDYELVESIVLSDDFKISLWKSSNKTEFQNYKDISFVAKTSGTTGVQKVIKVTHASIMSNVICLRRIFELTPNDVVFLASSLTFDLSILEMFLSLSTGSELLIVPNHLRLNPSALLDILFDKFPITLLQMPPSLFLRWTTDQISRVILQAKNLRILALGGEAFPSTILTYNKSEHLRLYNLYGTTEVSCWAFLEDVTKVLPDDVSLGQPLDDTCYEVRGENSLPISSGEGELFIGTSLRYCYVNEDIHNLEGTQFRATGDIVRINSKIKYLRRKDSLIKRFGVFVNCAEVEEMLSNQISLRSKFVWDSSTNQLFLFVTIVEYSEKNEEQIIDRLNLKIRNILPAHCYPDKTLLIRQIPVTINGKTDFNKLLTIAQSAPAKFVNSLDLFKQLLSKYLGIDRIVEQKSFLDCGGNSFIATQIYAEYQRRSGNNCPDALMTLLLNQGTCFPDYFTQFETNFSLKSENKTETLFNNEEIDVKFKLKFVWKVGLGACVDASPVMVHHSSLGSLIVVGSHSGNLSVIKCDTGRTVSKIELNEAIEGSVSFCQLGNRVFVGCHDGNLHCIEIESGQLLWSFKTESTIKSRSIIIEEKVIFASYDKMVYCLETNSANLIWKYDAKQSITADLISQKGKIYFVTLQGKCICLSVETGLEVWCFDINAPVFATPTLFQANQRLLIADVKGNVSCVDIICGRLIWRFTAGGSIFSSPISYDDSIFFGCHDTNLYCLKISNDSCSLRFKHSFNDKISSRPQIFVQNENSTFLVIASVSGALSLFCPESKKIISSILLPGEIFSNHLLENGRIYVGCRDDNVYCYEIDTADSK